MKDGEVKQGYRFKPYHVFDIKQTDVAPEAPKKPNITHYCKVFDKWAGEEFVLDPTVVDEDGKNLSFSILKFLFSSISEKGEDMQSLKAACAAIVVCTKYNLAIEPEIYTVLDEAYKKKKIDDVRMGIDVLKQVHCYSKDFIEELLIRIKLRFCDRISFGLDP